MKKTIIRRAAALCAAVIILTSGCGSESGPAAVPDESTAVAIEKIQIEIEYDGDEALGDAIRKAAEEFNASQDIYVASVGNVEKNLQELAREGSSESQQDEAGEAVNPENQQDEASETEAGGIQADDGQPAGAITASVVFTDDNTAAAYASDDRRLDLRTCHGGETGKNSLYTIIDSLPEQMYETVCYEERGVFYLPVSVTAPVLYYNKTVYDGLGLSLPQTYSHLRDNSLNIYARYRTPGYLPYDLEGDVVAMMREQEGLAAQAENESESDVETGDAGTQTGDAGTQTGDAGTQTGDTGTQTGDAGTQTDGAATQNSGASIQSGGVSAQAGGADTQASDAGAQTGNAGAQVGNTDAQAGNAGTQAGNASTQAGNAGAQAGNAGTLTALGSTDNSDLQQAMMDAEVLQFFAGNCEAGYFRMVQHEVYPALDFATGAVAAFAGTPEDYEMATTGVTFDVGAIPWIMDREDAVYWVDTSGMLFFDQGEEKNTGAAAFAEYLLRDDVCSEFLESVGGLSPYRTVYESQAYRKNRRGFDEITMAAADEIQRADFVLMSDAKRRELDELLLYIIDKRVTAEDAVRIFAGS